MGFFSSKPKTIFPWKNITSEEQLRQAWDQSSELPAVFFKHSTRCSISAMSLARFEEKWNTEEHGCTLYFIDLIAFRAISNALEEMSGVTHQSPQIIVAKKQQSVYTASHSAIDAREIAQILREN
jgi:bacillithiol system protein YtxJ